MTGVCTPCGSGADLMISSLFPLDIGRWAVSYGILDELTALMADDQEERREIEAYLDQHQLQTFIGDAVNDIVKERPADPLVTLADALRACSDASRQIQKVRGRQILNGEALPALEVEILTSQGPMYGAVSSGPYDNIEEQYEGRGVLQAVESADILLAEVLVEKDPTQQTRIDKLLNQESSLPANVVTAASIACCKAGAKQTLVSVFEHIGAICNSEGGIPATAFSIINGGRSSISSLWVQDIFIVPTGDMATLSDQLMVASMLHRSLKEAARNAGQEILQPGPRGGFCNGAGTFEHLMDCLVASIKTADLLGSVEFVIDVHASRLIPPLPEGEAAGGGENSTSYNLKTFSPDKGAAELTSAQGLLDIYLDWLEKYPISAFVEPFAVADILTSKDLLARGHQVLRAKAIQSTQDILDPTIATPGGQGQSESGERVENVGGAGGEEKCLLRVMADESVLTPAQLVLVHEQRAANAVVIGTSKFVTVSDCITLANRANELGWTVVVSAVSEQELEGEFLAEVGVGLRAGQLLMGGLRSASTIAACARLLRIEAGGVPHLSGEHE